LPDQFESAFSNLKNRKTLVTAAIESFNGMKETDKKAITDQVSTEIKSWTKFPEK